MGAALLSVALVPLLLVAEQGREWGWGSGNAIACYVVGVLGAVAFFVQESRMGDEAILPLAMFRNRTVGVSSVASIIIGVAMFGGLAALPLYLQIVKGATPTEAGLLLLPMTLGIMAGSILSGQIISRTGRYRKFPIIGSALLTVSLFTFHFVEFDTPLWQTMIVMVAFGLGLGFNFQPLTLAVQNAVPPQQIGVATSTATFTRQIGGTLGTAVFLSILFSQASEKIASAVQAAAPTADFQAALARPGQRGVRPAAAVQAGGGRRHERCAAGQLVPQRPRRRGWPSPSSWASPRRWTRCSSSARPSWCSASSSCCSCRTSSCARARTTSTKDAQAADAPAVAPH